MWKINRFLLWRLTHLFIPWRVLGSWHTFSKIQAAGYLSVDFLNLQNQHFRFLLGSYLLLPSDIPLEQIYFSLSQDVPLLYLKDNTRVFPCQRDHPILFIHPPTLACRPLCPLLRKESHQNLWRSTQLQGFLFFPRVWEGVPIILDLAPSWVQLLHDKLFYECIFGGSSAPGLCFCLKFAERACLPHFDNVGRPQVAQPLKFFVFFVAVLIFFWCLIEAQQVISLIGF